MTESKQTVYLITGPSGSGKSTFAATRFPDLPRFEADDFFMVGDVYAYNRDLIKQAHDSCFAKTKQALSEGLSVVVSNTMTKNWEVNRYVDLCKDLGVDYKVFEMTGLFQNVHDIPESIVQAQADRFEHYPGAEVVQPQD